MQLKSIGESLTALNSINKVVNSTSSILANQETALTVIGKQYSTTTLKAAIAQSQLNKEQIKTILSANGLQGELLETTADELANAASTNAVAKAQAGATVTTTSLSNAFKGLIASIKGFAAAHPAIAAVTVTLAAIGATSATIIGIINATTTSVAELRKEAEKAQEESQNAANDLKSTQNELDQTNSKIQELENKNDITIIEENELTKLQATNKELERQLELQTKIYNKKSQDSAKATADYLESDKAIYNEENGDSIDTANWNLEIIKEYQTQLKDLQQQRHQLENELMNKGVNPDDFKNNFEWFDINGKVVEIESTIDNLNQRYLSKIKELQEKKQNLYDSDGEIYEQYVRLGERIDEAISKWSIYSNAEDYKTQLINNLTRKEISENDINVIISSLSDDEIQQAATLNLSTYIDIDKNTSTTAIKEALTSAQKIADEQAIQAKLQVQELDPTDFLKSSDDKINTATLADLQEEAELLSSISEELYKTGKINTSSMQSIIEKYPEAKEYLGDYMLGLISEAELLKKLQEVYSQDEQNYKKSLLSKAQADGTFYQTLVSNNQKFFTELSNAYGQDFNNYKNLAQAKAEIDRHLAQELAGIWGKYYDVVQNEITGLYEVTYTATADQDMDLGRYQMITGDYSESDKISKLEQIRDHLNKLQNLGLEQIGINFDTSWEGLSNFDPSSFEKSEKDTAKDYDLIERAIQKLEREISNLDTITNDTFISWNERNTALLSQIDKINEKINTQQAAYEQYMSLANNVGLDSYYQDLIKNGSIDVITITDKNLQNQIDTFQDFYDKALEAQDSIQELQSRLNELDKTKFDNIVKQFENIQNNISHTINIIDKKLNLIEEKGFFANSSIYENLISQYEKQLNILYDKHDKLTITLNSSDIQEGTQAWNELKQQINNVNESIIDTIISIEQFSNELNKNEFSKFDYFQDKISKLTSESDFYIDLMESMDKKTVDENGDYTNEGWTNAGLHAQNYNAYLKQAEEYALKIDSINKQLENDSYNTVLLEQKQEYIEAQRESILAAYEEKNAIKDLIKAGYEEQTNSLSKTIDKYKELLSSMKEAHDYEKNIREQTENLANLNKQYLASLGDDSEGNRKNIQQLEKDIKEAQEELQETQYEKLISDTEKLLDDLQADYEELMNQRLDNIDNELINIYSGINENANTIKNTLHQLSIDSDMLLSQEIKDIWNNPQPVVDLNSSVDMVNESISGTNTAIDNLKHVVENILNKMDMLINEKINQVETVDSNDTTYTSNIGSSNTILDYLNNNTNNNSDNNSSNYQNHDWWMYKTDYYPKEGLNIETSIVDRLKWHNYDSSMEARAIYYEKMGLGSSNEYYSAYDQNTAMLSWMKANGYANGSKYINKKQIAFTQENGSEMIYDKSTGSMLTPISMEQFIRSLQQKSGTPTYLETGDKVFTNEMSENLWKIAKNPYDFGVDIKPDLDYDIPPTTLRNKNNNVKIEFGDVHVVLPNVKNYQEFMQQAQADKNFARMIENIALGKAFGANTFDKFAFK